MERALIVTVRLHEGRYHGMDNRYACEWPPAPARLFQALLAGAACGVTVSAKTLAALDWLQSLPPPVIAAPRGTPGQGYVSFVPNNDLDELLPRRRLDDAVARTRVGKRIRPTLFDADAPIVYCWTFAGEDGGHASALCSAANGIFQLGRGIDMAWAEAATFDADEGERFLLRHGSVLYRPSAGGEEKRNLLCPSPGLLQSLVARFEGTRVRFRADEKTTRSARVFVQPPRPRLRRVAYGAESERFVFELREADDQAAYAGWGLDRAVELVETARDAAAGYLHAAVPVLADSVERFLIGRGAAEADKPLRVRIVPIPSVGHEHADMAIRRLAIRVPQSCPVAPQDVAWAFSQVAWSDEDGVILRELHRVEDDRMVSRFEGRARCWRSVTPLALPLARRRRGDLRRQEEQAKGGAERACEQSRAIGAVQQALRHAGVSASAVRVIVQREPFDRRGTSAERFAAGTRFAKETLWHASITFAEHVVGPLLLGDGRFLGLGLMCPYGEPVKGVIGFAITGGLADRAEPTVVARAARRAMMARVQEGLPRGDVLPTYVSGHRQDGSPAGDVPHRHIAVVADLARRRVLYLAPSVLDRRSVPWRDIESLHEMTANALGGMEVLRAGTAGRLTLVPTIVDPDSDPLFTPARIWESVTTYHVARHRRGSGADDVLARDVAFELDRAGWPRPESIEVLAARSGPRGGLSGRLRLVFRTAQAGPLLIGRTVHKGGGVFSGR